MSRNPGPLTQGQLALLRAVKAGGRRASEVAIRSGVKLECVYPMLARLVGRRLLRKDGRRPPAYKLTPEGERLLRATDAYQKALQAAPGG